MEAEPGNRAFTPPRAWESLLRHILPRGSVGKSILGDLREEHRRRAARSPPDADRWYRTEVLGIAVRALRDRLLGRWTADPRLAPRAGRGASGDPRGVRLMKSLRLAIRSLARAPRFTLVSVLTLGLGIGASVTIFALVNAVLLRPLDFPDSEALVNIRGTAPGMGLEHFPLSARYYFTYRSESTAFADMGFYSDLPASLTGEGDPEAVEAVVTSYTLFSTLRVDARLGRTFTEDEDRPGASPVVLLGNGLWRRRFGGDESVLGRAILVNGERHVVVGVMPPGFSYPGNTEIWVPARLDPETAPWNFSYPTVGRLAEGVTLEQATAQLVAIVGRIRDSYPEGTSWQALMDDGRYAPLLGGMKAELVEAMIQPLWILLGTVAFVLLIACTNVANLVLVRAEDRRQERAVRAAVGATRGALVRQSLTESAFLALAGGGAGVALAWVVLPVIVRQAPPRLPRLDEVGMDGTVLLFALGVTGIGLLIFGMAPLLRLSSSALLPSLRQGGHRATAGPRRKRSRNLLVGGQAALALILMVGSGLMVRSLWAVYRTDLGFDCDDLLIFQVSLPENRYETPGEKTAFHEEVLARLRALPGVEGAALTTSMPLAGLTASSDFGVEGQPTGQGRYAILLPHQFVSGGFAETLGIPVLAGETVTIADAHGERRRLMVNQALADRFWPGEDPVGKRMIFPGGQEAGLSYTVAGVLGTVRDGGVRRDASPMVYLPLMSRAEVPRGSAPSATYVLRAAKATQLGTAVHDAVWSVDPDLPLVGLRSGESIVADSVVHLTFTMVTLAMAAAMALILGAVGLFGVLSYSVAQRRRELAVHLAIGAGGRRIMARVVGEGVTITALGGVVGLAGAWGLSRFLQGILFGVEAADPLTYGGMAAALLIVATVAAYLPARRAASVDPAESMRAE